MKLTVATLLTLSVAIASAQLPDVIVSVDARPTFLLGEGRNSQLRWFDAYGNPSLVGFKARLENGNRITVTQRLAKQLSDGDPDLTDEFYLEAPGEWRFGKQVLPFGQKKLLRETALAFKLRTNLAFEEAPLEIAVVDAGKGRQRGVIGRIGSNAGLSFAFGEHFGIQDSAFSILRQDLGGLGRSRGYRTVIGADSQIFAYPLTFESEIVALRQGHTPLDFDATYTDIRAIYQFPNGRDKFSLAWAREWSEAINSFRLDGEFVLAPQVVLMPHLRFGSSGLNQFGTSIRLRL